MSGEKIVLMSCCAPCSAAAVRRLKEEGADFVVLFHNPNIFPRAEYDKRLAEQIGFCEKLGVKYAVGEYDHDAWLGQIKGFEAEPERGRRCAECFKMRLAWGAEWAAEHGCDKIASVFGVSPHKDQSQVDAAMRIAVKNFQLSIFNYQFDYAPEPGMYRQKYCGCEFSETYDGGK